MTALSHRTTQEIAETVERARRILAANPDVRRVWLFGSVARGEPLDWLSDFDLAVEGLTADAQDEAWSDLEAALGCEVDLLRYEEVSPRLRRQIHRAGRLIYAA